MEYGIIPEAPKFADLKYQYLCESASAIVSSLADTTPDIGVQLGVKLLKPYATRGESPEVLGMIGSILHHYSPSSAQYGQTMVWNCKPLVEQKSVLVLEGCTDILLCLFRQHMKEEKSGVGTMFLLDGIELEGLVYPQPELGPCYRALAAVCHSASLHLLQSLVESSRGSNILDASVCFTAKSMKQTFENHAVETDKIPEAVQLVRVLGIFESMVGDADLVETGSEIVACLKTSKDVQTGVSSPSSSLSLHLLLLQVALIVHNDAEPIAADKEPSTSAVFDKKGVMLLMQTLNRLQAVGAFESTEELDEMTKSFAVALARAFDAENAKKRLMPRVDPWDQKSDIQGIRSTDLHKYDSGRQERVVDLMLEI